MIRNNDKNAFLGSGGITILINLHINCLYALWGPKGIQFVFSHRFSAIDSSHKTEKTIITPQIFNKFNYPFSELT